MSKKNSCWGIEVGAYAIKGLRLISDPKGVRLAEYDVLPFKKVLTTPDLNVDEAIQLGLDQFLARHDVTKSSVMVSVPGHMAFARFAKLPPVEPKKIPDIVKFEAVQQIPFPIDQVEWDYQVFAQEDSPDVEVGIFAITKDRVSQFLSNYHAVKMSVDGVTLSPLAMYNAMAYDMELTPESDGVVFMDIGTTSTDVVIVEAGRTWLRTLPIGGNNFTESLVRAFKLSFPKAEKLKREAATSKYARQIFQAMRPVFADLVQEIQRSLGFYQSLNRDARLTRLIGMGSTFRLPGLQKFLKQQLQMEVERPMAADGKQQGFRRLSAEGAQAADFAEQTINLATAYGLALQGLGRAHVTANILPAAIQRQRMWRAKQPWVFIAASIMLLAAALALLQLTHTKEATAAAALENANKSSDVWKPADLKLAEWSKVQGQDRRPALQESMRVLYYRDLAACLLADLHEAAWALHGDSDPGNDARTPREQRRRLYVDSYDVKYLSTQTPDTWGTDDNPINLTDTAFENVVVTAGSGSGLGPDQPRAMLVTVRGYIPHTEAATLLTRDFLGWLKEHARQPDRPYVVESRFKIHVERFAQAAIPGATPAGGTAAGAPEDWRTFLPSRQALGDEKRDKDWLFTVQWLVQIKSPAEIEKDRSAPAAPAPAPAATPPTAPATRPAGR